MSIDLQRTCPSCGNEFSGEMEFCPVYMLRCSHLVWRSRSTDRNRMGKGERGAKLIAHRRTLLVLDGLEPLQNPPGPQEGRVRDPALQALLRELAAFNRGLCVITTRMLVADVADHERTSVLRRELEHLSNDAGISDCDTRIRRARSA